MANWSPFCFGAIDIRCWDDGAVLYNRLSGDTHQISLLALEILGFLDRFNASSEALIADDLTDVLEAFSPDERIAVVKDALSLLHQAGLVVQVSTC